MISLLFVISIVLRTTLSFKTDDNHLSSSVLKHSISSGLPRGNARLNEEGRRLVERVKSISKTSTRNAEEIPLLLDGKLLQKIIKKNARAFNDINIELSEPNLPSSIWTKREAKEEQAKSTKSTNQTSLNSYAADDAILEKLKPDFSCIQKLWLCSKIPNSMDCILNCYLKTNALAKPQTKFLYRLMPVFISYTKQLCPTFAKIYDEIQTKLIHSREYHNSLEGFLKAVGIDILNWNPDTENFKINGPSSLFNNLINYGFGDDFNIVKPILTMAGSWWKVELAEMQTFPAKYTNPGCSKIPVQKWFFQLIDAMTYHPINSDVFLRGYYLMTRGLSQNLPYPLDNMFAANVFALKAMTGVDCSLVTYAETGTPYVCLQPSPLDAILEDYAKTSKEDENPFSWIVCGAHQMEVPEFKQVRDEVAKEREAERKELEIETTTIPPTTEASENVTVSSSSSHKPKPTGEVPKAKEDLHLFPNPDEIDSVEDAAVDGGEFKFDI